jgi:hypothetical protein
MTEFGVRLPDLGDIVLAFALTFHLLAVCAAVSIPWMAAHLEFWGKKEEFRSDRATAAQLSDIAVYNLGAVFLSGMLSYLLASIRTPEKLFTAFVLLAPVLGLFLLFLVCYVGLIFLYRRGWKWRREIERLHVLTAVAAGVMAVFCVAFLVALLVGTASESLWPRLREDPWSIFRGVDFWFGWLYAFLAVFMTGGVIVMLTGREAFRWESGSSLAAGARLIRLGAVFSLFAIFLMIVLSGVLVLFRGLEPFEPIVSADRPELIPLAVVVFAGMVALVEILMSALKWRGSAPRAGLLAAVFLFLAVFGMTSIFSWNPGPLKQKDVRALVSTQGEAQPVRAPR